MVKPSTWTPDNTPAGKSQDKMSESQKSNDNSAKNRTVIGCAGAFAVVAALLLLPAACSGSGEGTTSTVTVTREVETTHTVTVTENPEPEVAPEPAPAPAPEPAPAPAKTTFKDGIHRVGDDIQPGTYRNTGGSGSKCYWERLSGFGGGFEEIIANELTENETVVTIDPTDVGFKSTRCGTWEML